MYKNAFLAGSPPRTLLGELADLLQIPYSWITGPLLQRDGEVKPM